MKRNTLIASMFTATALTVTAALAQLSGTNDFDIHWNTMDGGGITFATGGTLELGGTIGQHDATLQVLTGGTLELTGGFWTGVGGATCPADIAPTGGNGVVDVDDLLVVINDWGACDDPENCPADLAPPGGNDIVDVDDLLEVINAWGLCD